MAQLLYSLARGKPSPAALTDQGTARWASRGRHPHNPGKAVKSTALNPRCRMRAPRRKDPGPFLGLYGSTYQLVNTTIQKIADGLRHWSLPSDSSTEGRGAW